ncbi:putative cadherin domain-containing protein [Synechococcus sp. A15-127]|nr:putative cadherin domain-containing protein [Synechococcus sp. A15-127]
MQSNIASNLQVVADRSSPLSGQLTELTAYVWSWLRQRSAESDFERLIGKIFFSLDADQSFTVDQQASVDQLKLDLATGTGLSPLDFVLIPRASMPGLVGAYASQHPSGTSTVLINETWFDQATDQERVITLLQEIGHAVDDQLHPSSWDTVGDEGAYFARVILASQSEDVVKEWFNYDDHYILNIDGQAVAVEASNSNNAPTATYTTNHTVDEGGSVLVGVLTAIDPDLGASITYSLVGEAVPGFEITNGSGNSSSVSNARLPLRSTLQSGELFLGGDFIELGISNVGSFGTSGSKPSDFYGTIDSRDRIGLSNDADGFGTGDDLRIDFFLPGTPEERWSIGWGGNAKGSFSALVDNYNIGNLSNTSLVNTSTSAQLSGSFTGTVDNTAAVSQTHSFDPTKQFFKTSVTITNVASGALTDVLFMRSFDPDNTVYKGGEYITTNKIEKTFAAGDGAAMVSATSSDDSYSDANGSNSTVFFFSSDSRARVYTGGFSNSNPYDYRSGDDKNKTETADKAIGIVFDIGGLDAGESKTFDYFTSLTTIDESSSILNEISNGSWSFDPAHSAYDYLSDDNDKIVPITYRVTDEHGLYDDETFNITVSGVNDAPTTSGVITNTQANEAGINSDGSAQAGVNASGSAAALMATITDVDGNSLTISQGKKATSGSYANVPTSSTSTNGLAIAGTYGSLNVGADGSYLYTVDQGNAAVDALREDQSLTDSFTLLVSDGAGGSVEQSLALTIDGTNDAPYFKSGESGLSPTPIEYGTISDLLHDWKTITLSSSFVDPVVIAGDMSLRGGDEAVTRVRAHPDDAGKITNRFQIKLVESSDHDGPHTTEIISYLVVESGSWELEDGTKFSAGKTPLSAYESFVSVPIPDGQQSPTVLTQLQTNANEQYLLTRTDLITGSSFSVMMEAEEGGMSSTPASELVGWLAIESGTSSFGESNKLDANISSSNVSSTGTDIAYSSNFSTPNALFAKIATHNDPDTGAARIVSQSDTGFRVLVDEEQAGDSETTHGNENVAYIVIDESSGQIPVYQDVSELVITTANEQGFNNDGSVQSGVNPSGVSLSLMENISDVEDDNLTILRAKEATAGNFKSMNSDSIAKSVKPSSYDMINGSSGSYNYWDESYDGSGNPLQDSSSLSGGLGDLTDGVVPTDNWQVVEQSTGAGPYVGWQSNPSIEFNFDRAIHLDAFKIYVDDSNGHGGVSVPASITLTTSSGSFSSGTLSDPSSSQPTSYLFSGLDLQGSKFTLNINRSSQWVFVSEVEFFEATLPVDGLYGDLVVGEDGSYDYVVDNDNSTVNALSESDSLDDIFLVQITDGNGGIIDQAVEFSIDGTDDKPILSLSSTTSFTEDASSNQVGSLVASFTASDPEGASLTIALSDTSNYALSTNSNRVLLSSEGLSKVNKGAPLPAFTLQASDGSLTSSAVTVSPSVTAVDDPAIITGDNSGSGAEDTTITGTLTATDEEGLTDNTYFSIASNHAPAKGTASINPKSGAWSYEPAANYYGTDSFMVTVTDDLGGTTTQSVSLTITAVDDPAVISGDTSAAGEEDTTITGTLSATDVEGLTDNTYYSIASDDAPAHGTASINAQSGAWSYEPAANYYGTDSFTVTVTDDLGGTTTQDVSLSITPVQDAPLGLNGSISLDEDTIYSFSLSDFPLNDPDQGDTLSSIKLTGLPERGQLTLNDQPLESISIIDFETASLSGWETLGNVSIAPTGSDFTIPDVSLDQSTAGDYYALLSTDILSGKKASTTPGNVEWCVIYDYDNSRQGYRIGIDKRQFPVDYDYSGLTHLSLLDLWDGQINYYSDDLYWAEYWILTDTPLDFSGSQYSDKIRSSSGSYGIQVEFSFVDSTSSASDLESFLGLSPGLLSSLSSDQDSSSLFLDSSGLKRTVTVEAGQQLEFDWKFTANDELPYNDTFITVAGADIYSVASVYSVGDYEQEEGTFTYVFSEAGQYVVGVAVMDEQDSNRDSYLAVDNFRLSSVGQTSEIDQSGFSLTSLEVDASQLSALKFHPGLNASDDPFAEIQYQVQDQVGAYSQPVTLNIDVQPVNDFPVASPDYFEAIIDEQNGVISTSASIVVSDVDVVDDLSIAVASVDVIGNDLSFQIPASLTDDNNKALFEMMSLSANLPSHNLDSLPSEGALVHWTFESGSSGDEAFEFLAKGESLQLNYVLDILDNGVPPLSTSPEIDIIIIGTNDTPYVVSGDFRVDLFEDDIAPTDHADSYYQGVVSSSDAEGHHGSPDSVYPNDSIQELDPSEYVITDLYATGEIEFSDFDITDDHTVGIVSVDIDSNSTQSPSLTLMDTLRDFDNTFSVDDTLQDGQINWSFTLPNLLIDYLGDDESLDAVYTIAITDSSLITKVAGSSEVDTTFFDVSISIYGHDDQLQLAQISPVVISEVDQSSERVEQGLTGLLDVIDPDSNPLIFGIYGFDQVDDELLVQTGLYGDLHLETDTGAYRYEYNFDSVESLDTDDHLYEEFHLTVSNGNNQVQTELLTIDIFGADDAPELGVIESGLIAEMIESSEVTESALSGQLHASDIDDDDNLIFGILDGVIDHSSSVSTKHGDYGLMSVDISTGEYSYSGDSLLIEALGANEIVSDEFTILVNDGDGVDVTETFFVHLVGAADAPTISAPDHLVTDEDISMLFSNEYNLFVDDVDENLSSVSLEVSFGRFLLETTADIDAQLSDDGSFIQLSGDQSQLNSALSDLEYKPDQDFNGDDDLIVTAYDASPSPLSTALTVPLTVNPVNDSPFSLSASVSLNEDQPYGFDLFDFYFEDIDVGDYLNGIEITSLPHTGTLLLDNVPLTSADAPDPLIISAADIASLSFMPQPDEAYMNYDSLSFKVLDQGNLASPEESITLNVNPVADLIDIVATDNVINQSEKAVGITLSGTAEGADFVFVEWGGVEKVATVQDGVWSVLYPTIVNVVFDLGDFQTAAFSEVSLADVFAQIPQLTFEDVMSFNVISTEVPDDEIDSVISTVAMSSDGEFIGSQDRSVTVDTTPPPTPKVASFAGNSEINYIESRDRIFVEGYSEPLNTVQLKWDRTKHTTTSDEDGYWSASIRSRLFEEGLHQIMFTTSTDPAGNESGPSVDLYGVDTVRPTWPTINDITSDDVINISEVDSGVYLNGEAEGDSRIVLDWNGTSFTTYADVLDRWEIFIPSDDFYPPYDDSGFSPILATYNTQNTTQALALSADGNTLFLAEDAIGLQMIDISNPASPSSLGTIHSSGDAVDIVLSPDGNTAFLADLNSGLQIIDISNLSSPDLISTLSTSGEAWGVTLSADGNTAFVADSESGIQIVDVTNLSSPSLIATFNTPGIASDVRLSADANTAYVADGDSGVQIIDISELSSPSLISSLDTEGFANRVVLSADGNTAFVADWDNGLQIIDVTEYSRPALLSTIDTSGFAYDVTLSDDSNTAYVADDDNGLQIIDVSNLTRPSLMHSLNTQGYAVDVTLSPDSDIAYVADNTSGLQIISLPDRNVQLIGDLSITSIDLFDNISSTRTITPVFDLSTPDTPVLSTEYSDLIILNQTSRSSGFSLDGTAEPLGTVFIRLGFSTWTVDVDQDGSWYFDLPTSSIPLDSSDYQFEFTAIDSTGNRSNTLTVPVIVDSKSPRFLSIDGILFDDNAISPVDLVDPLVINGSSDLDASLIELTFFDDVYSTVPDDDGFWSFVLDPSMVPFESLDASLIISATDEYQNTLSQSFDFVVALDQPEPPVVNPISEDGYLNDSDSRSDVTVDGTAPLNHHVRVDYRDRTYDIDVDDKGHWTLSLPFPSNDTYPVSATTYFHPSHESQSVLTDFVVDTKPPRATAGELFLLDDAFIQLRFDEELASGNITHSSLKVLVDQKAVDVNSAFISSDDPELLNIYLKELSTSAQEISITYRPRSSDSFVVQDISGNTAEHFFNFSVNHLVTQSDVPSLASDFKSVLFHGDNPINVTANHSNNVIVANSADNIIEGLPGADVLTGGSGSDRFVYRKALDSFLGDSRPYYDHITDFNPSVDVLQLPFGSSAHIGELTSISELTSSSLSDAFVSSDVQAFDILVFDVDGRSFILANDQDPAYSPYDDILIEVTGMTSANYDVTSIEVLG